LKRYDFLAEAQAEFLDSVRRYAEVRQDLGSRFRVAVLSAIEAAALFPEHGRPSEGDTRSRAVNGFPYRVVYIDETDRCLVVAVAHHRRAANYWIGRST
jgi:toxin ParE1/3/4